MQSGHALDLSHFTCKSNHILIFSFTDPNAPKKPANAFLMFCQHDRLSVLEEYSKKNPHGEMSHQDLTKELAKKWNDLTAEEKKVSNQFELLKCEMLCTFTVLKFPTFGESLIIKNRDFNGIHRNLGPNLTS